MATRVVLGVYEDTINTIIGCAARQKMAYPPDRISPPADRCTR